MLGFLHLALLAQSALSAVTTEYGCLSSDRSVADKLECVHMKPAALKATLQAHQSYTAFLKEYVRDEDTPSAKSLEKYNVQDLLDEDEATPPAKDAVALPFEHGPVDLYIKQEGEESINQLPITLYKKKNNDGTDLIADGIRADRVPLVKANLKANLNVTLADLLEDRDYFTCESGLNKKAGKDSKVELEVQNKIIPVSKGTTSASFLPTYTNSSKSDELILVATLQGVTSFVCAKGKTIELPLDGTKWFKAQKTGKKAGEDQTGLTVTNEDNTSESVTADDFGIKGVQAVNALVIIRVPIQKPDGFYDADGKRISQPAATLRGVNYVYTDGNPNGTPICSTDGCEPRKVRKDDKLEDIDVMTAAILSGDVIDGYEYQAPEKMIRNRNGIVHVSLVYLHLAEYASGASDLSPESIKSTLTFINNTSEKTKEHIGHYLCPICLDDASENYVRNDCGHGACLPCLTKSIKVYGALNCPECKAEYGCEIRKAVNKQILPAEYRKELKRTRKTGEKWVRKQHDLEIIEKNPEHYNVNSPAYVCDGCYAKTNDRRQATRRGGESRYYCSTCKNYDVCPQCYHESREAARREKNHDE